MSLISVRVANLRSLGYNNLKEWMQDENNIYIGRKRIVFINGTRYPPDDSPWANPFKIGINGDRSQVIEKYENYIRNNPLLLNRINELKGKCLGCWCAPEPCHGDVLLKIIRELG